LNSFLKIKKHLLLLAAFTLLNLTSYASHVRAQDEGVAENFVNLGLISISDLLTLPAKTKSIVFRIKNNTSRTISQIYGWVYKYDKVSNGRGKNFVLMNNPHRGGRVTEGAPHRPGTIAEWHFPLVREPFTPNAELDYSLRVHPRSIFFASIEPGGIEDTAP
jgi:hypothetical protein